MKKHSKKDRPFKGFGFQNNKNNLDAELNSLVEIGYHYVSPRLLSGWVHFYDHESEKFDSSPAIYQDFPIHVWLTCFALVEIPLQARFETFLQYLTYGCSEDEVISTIERLRVAMNRPEPIVYLTLFIMLENFREMAFKYEDSDDLDISIKRALSELRQEMRAKI